MGLDADRFRGVMGSLAAGVTVVTTRDRQGEPRGLTATAVCSVSLEPPLVLVCIDRSAECHEAFWEAVAFSVNLLRDDQEELSRHFARKDIRKFEGIAHRPGVTGVPILCDVLAHVECRVMARHPGGDHTIFVGEAVDTGLAAAAGAGSALLYFRGGYARLEIRLPADAS
jgi:flavin reductase (DIM6/NTAB) family NADH-FMN oxidoreductase RutF